MTLRAFIPPYNAESYRRFLQVGTDPPDSMYQPDPLLGFRHVPGQQRAWNGDITWMQTHGADSLRVMPVVDSPSGEIWVFGCSYTHGHGVNDDAPYPVRIQSRLKGVRVTNFGIDGSGTVQALLAFREALKNRDKPRLVIFGHIGDHQVRDRLLPTRLKAMALLTRRGFGSIPYGVYEKGRFEIRRRPLAYHAVPGARWLALLNLVDSIRCEAADRKVEPEMRAVCLAAIMQFASECQTAGVPFVVAGVDPGAGELEGEIRISGIPFIEAWTPHGDTKYYITPDDTHPNALGHQQIADKILAGLQQLGILSSTAANQ